MLTNLYQQKWQKFLKRVWLFRFIPFVDFVLTAGSLATGNINKDSDFDVIVGTRQGRMSTVRMFCFVLFKFFGRWAEHPNNSKDKFCFSHFVTPKAYRLSPPYNEYWKNLYKKLAPVYGNSAFIQKFYDANADWMGEERKYAKDKRHLYENSNCIGIIVEKVYSGKFGDWFEKKIKDAQTKRIKNRLTSQFSGYKPRIIFNDNELEFHPDTKRIELYIESK